MHIRAIAAFVLGQELKMRTSSSTLESIDGNRLEIEFDKAGTKKVIDSFVRPA